MTTTKKQLQARRNELYTPIEGVTSEDYADVQAGEWWEIEGVDGPVKVFKVLSDCATVEAGYLINDVHVHASRFVRPVKF